MDMPETLLLKDGGICLPDTSIKDFLSGCPGSSRNSQEKEDMAVFTCLGETPQTYGGLIWCCTQRAWVLPWPYPLWDA